MLAKTLTNGIHLPKSELTRLKRTDFPPEQLALELKKYGSRIVFCNPLNSGHPEALQRIAHWLQKADRLYKLVPEDRKRVILPEWHLPAFEEHFSKLSEPFFTLHGHTITAKRKGTSEGIEIAVQPSSSRVPHENGELESLLKFAIEAPLILVVGKLLSAKVTTHELRQLFKFLGIKIPVFWNWHYTFDEENGQTPIR